MSDYLTHTRSEISLEKDIEIEDFSRCNWITPCEAIKFTNTVKTFIIYSFSRNIFKVNKRDRARDRASNLQPIMEIPLVTHSNHSRSEHKGCHLHNKNITEKSKENILK